MPASPNRASALKKRLIVTLDLRNGDVESLDSKCENNSNNSSNNSYNFENIRNK